MDLDDVGTKVEREVGGKGGSHGRRPDESGVLKMIRKEKVSKIRKRGEE